MRGEEVVRRLRDVRYAIRGGWYRDALWYVAVDSDGTDGGEQYVTKGYL